MYDDETAFAFRMSIPNLRRKASLTSWPPLVLSGLVVNFETTSTDIPFSKRIPLAVAERLMVALNNDIKNRFVD